LERAKDRKPCDNHIEAGRRRQARDAAAFNWQSARKAEEFEVLSSQCVGHLSLVASRGKLGEDVWKMHEVMREEQSKMSKRRLQVPM
jgi:hypothetical protein